jgi:hypothetical protein
MDIRLVVHADYVPIHQTASGDSLAWGRNCWHWPEVNVGHAMSVGVYGRSRVVRFGLSIDT